MNASSSSSDSVVVEGGNDAKLLVLEVGGSNPLSATKCFDHARGCFDDTVTGPDPEAKKRCSKCRDDKPLSGFAFELKRGSYRYRSDCKNCRATRVARMIKRRRAESPHEIWAVLGGGWARARAKVQGLPVDLPREAVLRVIDQAKGCCTYCRRAIDFQCSLRARHAGPSLDRLVLALGYVESNLVLSCYRCNAIKGDATPDELLNIATVAAALIAERRAV